MAARRPPRGGASLLLAAALRLWSADAFLNLGSLDYSNLGGQGPDTGKPKGMRYKDVAAVGDRFLDLLVETPSGYTPFDAAQNVGSGKGNQVGSINIRVGTSLEALFRFVEAGGAAPSSIDRFFFTVYLSDDRQRVRVHTNATGPARSAGLSRFCIAEGSNVDLQVQEGASSVLFAPSAAVDEDGNPLGGKFARNPSVTDPYELGEGLRKQAVTLSFANVSEFRLSVDVAGMVGEEGANFVFSGTASVEEYCLPWVGGDGLYYDFEPPFDAGPMLAKLKTVGAGVLTALCLSGLLVAVAFLANYVKNTAGPVLASKVRDFWVKRANRSYLTPADLDMRENSSMRVDSITPLMQVEPREGSGSLSYRSASKDAPQEVAPAPSVLRFFAQGSAPFLGSSAALGATDVREVQEEEQVLVMEAAAKTNKAHEAVVAAKAAEEAAAKRAAEDAAAQKRAEEESARAAAAVAEAAKQNDVAAAAKAAEAAAAAKASQEVAAKRAAEAAGAAKAAQEAAAQRAAEEAAAKAAEEAAARREAERVAAAEEAVARMKAEEATAAKVAEEATAARRAAEEAVISPRAQDTSRDTGYRFHVTVLKSNGREVGIRVKALDECIMIRSIAPDGLISDWNQDLPDKEVREGDFIVEVNGSKGHAEHLEQALRTDKALKLTILRDEAKAAAVLAIERQASSEQDRQTSKQTAGAASGYSRQTSTGMYSQSASSTAVALRGAAGSMRDVKTEEKERLEGMLAQSSKDGFQKNSKMLRRTRTLLSSVEGELGNPRRQIEILEESLKELETEVGPQDPEVAQVLTNLANAHANLGDAKMQRELLQRALAIKEKSFGPKDRRLAVTLTSLGDAYGTLGMKKEQMATLERALDIKETAFGKDHHEVAVTLANLGIAHRRVGEPKLALEFFERAVDIKEKEFGRDHPKVALTLGNMAQAHGDLGNLRTQRELLERSYHILSTNYGTEHPHTALARQALGAVKRQAQGGVTPRNVSR